MNEPFLLSNLIELQEIDNKIYKIENEKKSSESVVRLMSLESDFKELTEKITIQKKNLVCTPVCTLHTNAKFYQLQGGTVAYSNNNGTTREGRPGCRCSPVSSW